MTLPRIVIERCQYLAWCSEEPDAITRPFASESMQCAHERVAEWMREAGMTVRWDNVGNLHGRYAGVAGSDATLLLGSHLDSVRDAGKYDGPLGVVVAIAAVQRLRDAGRHLPFAIEVLAFADGDAITGFGGDPDRIADDRWSGGRLLGYCEVHIEQGPVLESRNLPVGVVSAIAGQARFRITFTGEAAHAGTTPMDQRRDALAAAAIFVQAVESYAGSQEGLVATVGQLEVTPGAANVIPGHVALSLDVRHADDSERLPASRTLLDIAAQIAKHRKIGHTTTLVSENGTVPCSRRLVSSLSQAVRDLGHPVVELASGAGHDAVAMSTLTEVGMLFVRCKGGVSHNPAESVTTEDVAVAIDVLSQFLELVAKE